MATQSTATQSTATQSTATQSTRLVVDYRESGLISRLNQLKISHQVENLEIGDIQIQVETPKLSDQSGFIQLDENPNQLLVPPTSSHQTSPAEVSYQPVIIIERKTVSDYLSSIQNKHLSNQLIRMRQSDAKLILLVEGQLQPSFGQVQPVIQTRSGQLTVDRLYNSMLNRIFVDQIPVIRSDNLAETVIWIQKLLEKLPAILSKQPQSKPKEYLETVIKTKRSDNVDPTNCYLLQLTQIPGVSLNIAKAIQQAYPNLFALVNAYKDDKVTQSKPEKLLAKLPVGQRKIGPVVSQRVYQFLKGGGATLPLNRGSTPPPEPGEHPSP